MVKSRRRALLRAVRLADDARAARDADALFRAVLDAPRASLPAPLADDVARWAAHLVREPAGCLLAAARVARRVADARARRGDVARYESLLAAALRAVASSPRPGSASAAMDTPASSASRDARERAARKQAAVDLAAYYCQEGQDRRAAEILTREGYRYRLAPAVMRWRDHRTLSTNDGGEDETAAAASSEPPVGSSRGVDSEKREIAANRRAAAFVRVFDDALPRSALAHLRSVFDSDASGFWAQHGYHEPGCGFFSYAHRLPPWNAEDVGNTHPLRSTMDAIVRRVWRVAAAAFPRAREATSAEWWAHCRPHGSGHQLHFDSDDEGKGPEGIRHPICSAVVFVTGDVGGPTLVTDQTSASKKLAQRGWLVEPVAGRVAVFDGRYLHGVVPGRGPAPRLPRNHVGRAAGFSPCSSDRDARRITLMVAFWDEMKARPGGDGSDPRASFPKGSARPFPDPKLYLGDRSRPKGIDWPELFHAMHLTSMPDVVAEAATGDGDEGGTAGGGGGGAKPEQTRWVERCATPVGRVWQDVDEAENDACFPSLALEKISSVPPYDRCFMY